VIDGKEYKTTEYLYNFERTLGDDFVRLYTGVKYNIDEKEIIMAINVFTTFCEIRLTHQQTRAVIECVQNKCNVLTGFPGTGKSTIIKCVCFVLNSFTNGKQIASAMFKCGTDDTETESDSEDDDGYHGRKTLCTTTNKYMQYSNIALLAPTGLAYVNLASKTRDSMRAGKNETYFNPSISGTIHRAVYAQFDKAIKNLRNWKKEKDKEPYPEDESYKTKTSDKTKPWDKTKTSEALRDGKEKPKPKEKPCIPGLIVVDEFSMVDIFIFRRLLDWCKKFNCRLLLVGDENQLPSIGAGCLLRSMTESTEEYDIVNVSRLTEIKRQDGGCLLHNIKQMTTRPISVHDMTDSSMIFLDINQLCGTGELSEQFIRQIVRDHSLNSDNCKFLTYFKDPKYVCNVADMNNILQKIFNPNGVALPKRKYDKSEFRNGDRVIRTQNDTSQGITHMRANGSEGTVSFEKSYSQIMTVEYQEDVLIHQVLPQEVERTIFYEEFMLAYGLTVHKSQGCQFKTVVIFIDPHQSTWNKSSLYTAISRAQERCIIVSDRVTFEAIQRNTRNNDEKVTRFLKEFIEYEFS